MRQQKNWVYFLENTPNSYDKLLLAVGQKPIAKITFRDARQIRLASYGPWRGEKPVRDDHSLLPCARGSHACSRGDDCAAEMFFSLFYLYFILLKFVDSGCKIT